MHYNKDHRGHQQHVMTNNICITEHMCQVCCKKVKTSKSSPCKKHVLQIPLKCNGKPCNGAVSCCFLSQYSEENAKIADNEDLYVEMDCVSKVSCYTCMSCKEPFLALLKMRRAYEDQQEKINGLFGSTTVTSQQEHPIQQELKAYEFKVQDVIKAILDATKEEENLRVEFVKNSSLALSKDVFIDGMASNIKKLMINFFKDSVVAKQIVLGQPIETKFLLEPHKKMTLSCLTGNILSLHETLQMQPICHGIYEEHWVAACELYNIKNKYKEGKNRFCIDVSHALQHPKQITTIHKTVRSANLNGKECTLVLPPSSKSSSGQARCEPCKQLLRKCIRYLPPAFVSQPPVVSMTSPHSKANIGCLDHEHLISRCQKMADYIANITKSNNRMQKRLSQEKRSENLIDLPKNVNLTSLTLSQLVELALSKQCLNKDSVLHALLCDTVVSLMKSEKEQQKSPSKNRSHAKGMRFHPVVLKWCVELANKCGKGGYALVREILPIPSLTTVNSYRQSCKSYRPISQDNLKIFSQELSRRKSKGIGGIHWDEIYIKKGVKVCARTNELVGFEDLEIPADISNAIDEDYNDIEYEQITSNDLSDSDDDTSSGNSSTASDVEEETTLGSQKPVVKMILQFFWSSIEGDFTWPVASFPLQNINAKILSKCVWNTVKVLSDLKFGPNEQNCVQVLYGVCDGATHSSAFFNHQGQVNWMAENPYNNNKPIFWLSDPPHMIKKLRNFIISQNRHLTYGDFEINLQHLMDVAERGLTKLSFKHLFLTSRNKMSVKRAVETCSSEVADDIMQNSKFGFKETVITRIYLRQVASYFRIMNSTSLDPKGIHHLLQVLLFFKRWFESIQHTVNSRTGTLKDHWKQFISRHTYKDLMRSIRGFVGLVSFISMNHPHVKVVPRTTNQDDVENYFSLQRGRIPGGEATVQQYFEGNSTLATDLLVKAEKHDINKESFIGSYSAVVTPNYVSLPLKRKKISTMEHNGNNLKLKVTQSIRRVVLMMKK